LERERHLHLKNNDHCPLPEMTAPKIEHKTMPLMKKAISQTQDERKEL
jgi:hypothetical protein